MRQGLKKMKPGDHYILYLPSEIAYGKNPQMGDLSERALVFHIELLVRTLQAHTLIQIYTDTNYCLVAFCTWVISGRGRR
jgi:hypothetical protein